MSTGYGRETWCERAIVTGRYAAGWRVVAQALFRRLITPRGSLRGAGEASTYGLDLAAYVGAVGYPAALAALPGLVAGELRKDDRVADVSVTATMTRTAGGLIAIALAISVVLEDEGGEFALTVITTEAGTDLVSAVKASL